MLLNQSFIPSFEVPEGFYLVVDTREQQPLFHDQPWVIHKKLDAGDYSVLGFESQFAIERKSIEDLLSSLGVQRGRFERELAKLEQYAWKAILIEGEEKKLYTPSRFSSISLYSVYSSLCSLEARNFHIYYAPTRTHAQWWVLSRLTKLFKHRRTK